MCRRGPPGVEQARAYNLPQEGPHRGPGNRDNVHRREARHLEAVRELQISEELEVNPRDPGRCCFINPQTRDEIVERNPRVCYFHRFTPPSIRLFGGVIPPSDRRSRGAAGVCQGQCCVGRAVRLHRCSDDMQAKFVPTSALQFDLFVVQPRVGIFLLRNLVVVSGKAFSSIALLAQQD